MQTYRINAHDVLFESENHQYIVDGRHVPSITQMIDDMSPSRAPKVDAEILKKAAKSGNDLKRMIMNYETEGLKTYHKEMQSYIALKRQHQLDAVHTQPIVLLYDSGVVIAAGRFDMVVRSPYIKGLGITNIKRSRHLNHERLTLQLNLYKRAYEQTYRKRIDYLKCIHIRNRYNQYVDIPLNHKEAHALIKSYTDKHPLDYEAFID